MGKKDASAFNSQPVDQYRKQIGKQDWKKSRGAVKSMKLRADNTNEATPQQIVLMITLVIVGMAALYGLLLWSVGGGLVQERPEPPVT